MLKQTPASWAIRRCVSPLIGSSPSTLSIFYASSLSKPRMKPMFKSQLEIEVPHTRAPRRPRESRRDAARSDARRANNTGHCRGGASVNCYHHGYRTSCVMTASPSRLTWRLIFGGAVNVRGTRQSDHSSGESTRRCRYQTPIHDGPLTLAHRFHIAEEVDPWTTRPPKRAYPAQPILFSPSRSAPAPCGRSRHDLTRSSLRHKTTHEATRATHQHV